MRWLLKLVMSVCALVLCAPTHALDRTLDLDQFNLRSWLARDLAPANVTALAQTPEGLLWLGTSSGLVVSDGISFQPHARSGAFRLPSTNISTVHAGRDGSLWIGFVLGGVARIHKAELTAFAREQGLPEGAVHALDQDRDGTLWAATSGGLARLQGDRWQHIDERGGLAAGPAWSVFVDRQGRVWIATRDAVLTLVPGETRFKPSLSFQSAVGAVGSFAQAPDDSVWLSVPGVGIVRVDETQGTTHRLEVGERTAGRILFDRDGNLWMTGDGISRLVAPIGEGGKNQRWETLTRADGLSSSIVLTALEDREGNLWTGTSAGLDRLNETGLIRLPLPWSPGRTTLVPASDGSVWVSGAHATTLFNYHNGERVEEIGAPPFTAGTAGVAGELWFGGPRGIGRLQNHRLTLTPLPAVARGREVQAMTLDRSGALWISVHDAGVFRLDRGEWTENGGIAELPRATALTALTDAKGDLWLGYSDSRLARVSSGKAKTFTAADGLDVGAVTALHATDTSLWIGGELALMTFDGNEFRSVQPQTCQPFTAVSGITESKAGDLWLFRGAGLTRVDAVRDQLATADNGRVECTTFVRYEGLPGLAQQLWPTPSLIQATDGRLWLAASDGIAWVDPERMRRPLNPPATAIARVYSPGGAGRLQDHYDGSDAPIRLPIHTRDLQIEYTALTLTLPEQVRFRYRLDGLDESWRAAGSERQATYTNLGPGVYRFRVVASQDLVHWSTEEASLQFEILPAFYQTRWFAVLCVLAALLIVVYIVRLQMRRSTDRLRARLEERMLERERIARDLHDTLLQGLQGLILRFHSVATRLPDREPLRVQMEKALERADQVLIESRDKVKDLRNVSGGNSELSQDIAEAGQELAGESASTFSVTMQGTARALHLIIREETFHIAREAVANAFAHANAERIEVEVGYERTGLRINIRDDGRGLDEQTLRAGRSGHWGLLGMRERARKIGASLHIYSRAGAGTEIDLRVPAAVAYSERRLPRRLRWGLQ